MKCYKVNQPLPQSSIDYLIKIGFHFRGGTWSYKKVLYRNDDKRKNPYVIVEIMLQGERIISNMMCDDGSIYTPFYNRDWNSCNMVCKKVIKRYNNILRELEKNNILIMEKIVYGKHKHKKIK